MLLPPVYPHTILKDSHIEQHLHPIILLWFYFSSDSKFIRLARLHFNETAHVTLHVVKSSLYSQRFTNISGFQHRIRFIKLITRSQECLSHRFADMFEMHPAILKERCFIFCIKQFLANSQFNGILFESLLHTGYIIRFFLLGMNPFIQEKIGNVTQQ